MTTLFADDLDYQFPPEPMPQGSVIYVFHNQRTYFASEVTITAGTANCRMISDASKASTISPHDVPLVCNRVRNLYGLNLTPILMDPDTDTKAFRVQLYGRQPDDPVTFRELQLNVTGLPSNGFKVVPA